MTIPNNHNDMHFENALDDGELTMEELERIAGGQSGGAFDASLGISKGDVQVKANVDSSYISYFGTNGTSSNHGGHGAIPLNLTSIFP